MSARRPRRSVSSEMTSSGCTLPRLTAGTETLDEPDLLVLLRRLEDQPAAVDLVDDLLDQAGARLAVGPVHAGVAGRAALADDLRRAGAERLADQLDPAVRGEDRVRVLLADLGVDGQPVGREPLDQAQLVGRRDRDRAARDLDAVDLELAQPVDQAVDAPAQPRQLRQRPAEHHRHARGAVAVELRLQVAGHVGRSPAEPDHVDVVGGERHQPGGGRRREAGVDDVRYALGARLGRPRGKVQEIRHGAESSARATCSCPRRRPRRPASRSPSRR